MVRARELLAGGVEEHRLKAVGRLLAEASHEPGFITETEMRTLHGTGSSFTLLQSDPDGLTLMFSRFLPDEETPVHNHGSWGVACVVSRRDRYRRWQLDADGTGKVQDETALGQGQYVLWYNQHHDN